MGHEEWYMPKAGNIDHLARRPAEISEPSDGQVTIAVKAIGLNFADVFTCLGLYSATPQGPFVPGLEVAGIVTQCGPATDGTKTFAVGDRVMAVTRFGAFTTALTIDARYVQAVPEGWSLEQAAAFPAQALTAWYGLVELGRLARGDRVLVHSAAGGTGLWAVKIAKALGAFPVGTVGSAAKIEPLVAATGIDRVAIVDRSQFGRSQATKEQAMATAADLAYGRPTTDHLWKEPGAAPSFDIVLDSLMGDWFDASHRQLCPMGRHVVFGAGSMTTHGSKPNWLQLGWRYLWRPRLDPLAMLPTNKAVLAFNLIWLYNDFEKMDRVLGDLWRTVPELGEPVVGSTFSWTDLPNAIKFLQQGQSVGKVVVTVP